MKTITSLLTQYETLTGELADIKPTTLGSAERLRALQLGGRLCRLCRAIWIEAEADLDAVTPEQVEYIEAHVPAPCFQAEVSR